MKLQRYIYLSILFFCTIIGLNAQDSNALAVHGNMRIHENAKVGFHTNLINNGIFNQNFGLVGFYNNLETLYISGNNISVFNDIEVDVLDNLVLLSSVDIKNNMSFINGTIQTPRDNSTISFNYLENALYAGEGNQRYIDGYTSAIGNGAFSFPVGDNSRLRPILIPNQASNPFFKAAYFFENPNSPNYFSTQFDTEKIAETLTNITQLEFWDFKGTEETTVTLTWDDVSDIPALSPLLSKLRVVGWNKQSQTWVDLGNTATSGDLNAGSIQSISFIPNNFEVLTIGSDLRGVLSTEVTTDNINFAITPNGDGKNDLLVFENLDVFYNNKLIIYNRWGSLVYKKENYNNTWDGTATHSLTISKSSKLPTGTYFYFLQLNDNSKSLKGWIYVTH